MNQAGVNNRLLVMMAGAIVSPWIDKRFGVQLTPVDTAALIVLAYHCGAAAAKAGWTTFQSYFPPKNPTQAAQPPKVT